MKFKLFSTTWDTDELIERYPFVKKYGLEDPHKIPIDSANEIYLAYRDIFITVNSLEDLMIILNKAHRANKDCYDLVIGYCDDGNMFIELYDGYRE